jgi:hypothetical protein
MIETPKDMSEAPSDAECRVRQKLSYDCASAACSKANFGWMRTQRLYKKEELVGRNMYGNCKNIPAISPRRRHAIAHAVSEVYGNSEGNMKEAVYGINAGLRKMRYKKPDVL